QVNKYVDEAPPATRYEGDTMIVPVLKEVLVVEKKLLLVEEVHIKKQQLQTEEKQQVTLRKEDVSVTHVSGDESATETS
ncbi:MAG: YsnF/AvaK domain-containing protein, partial [Hymenobacteraceae bacterium]|nr:YsnF/AvaK domain-containing protein [Hymenobacteraceae bacterium]MDX5394569.1 YsnF/AvaK domain-containing protein [Hymenobacteraceae bacterium]MDX5510590.1 YsnF/AvaK domain-containing protein [Hymenobacteraceae bacterium]